MRRFLARNAGTVRYIAARLARRGVLDGDEVAAIVRGPREFASSSRDAHRRV